MAAEPAYTTTERARAAAWKRVTRTLPDEARAQAPYVGKDGVPGTVAYDFCLPPSFAELSLLPEVRATALALFKELGIPWHASVDGGPGNHLLSSQVQCVNALGQMITDPARIVAAFGEMVDIAEVLEIEPGRFLTFEYIGDADFFGGAPHGQRTRGSMCTSVDAAFLYRTSLGGIELALVEWKYTENYSRRRPSPVKDATRRRRYGSELDDPEGPVRNGLLSFNDLLDEPFYQLMRQQLLAHQLETTRAHGAERVRVIHVAPKANTAYQASVHRRTQLALGTTVDDIWHELLRRPDRFISIDSSRFLDEKITSLEYSRRYGDYLVWNKAEAERICDDDVENHLYGVAEYDADVTVHDEGIELIVEGLGTMLEYPFHLFELYELAEEVEAAAEAEDLT